VFTDHQVAVAFFKSKGKATATCKTGDETMSNEAAKAGFDSIQFTAHNDGGTNDNCCRKAGAGAPCRIEIVGTKLQGSFACTDKLKGADLRAGWQASRACDCTEAAFDGYVNCKGVPLTATPPDPAMNACIQKASARLPTNRSHGELVDAIASCK
jgi:hypothetical protein